MSLPLRIEDWIRRAALDPLLVEELRELLVDANASTFFEDGGQAEVPALDPRFDDLGSIGSGGMGHVRRVRDKSLNRVMALKTLHEAVDTPAGRARFVAEAQATAQLQHPGVVPVHELGFGPDGRPFFTMREIVGRTFTEVIRSGLPLRRLVDAFLRACEAVAYAHSRGVLHRDLKPDNIMVGAFGEVMVVDWGLVKIGPADVEPVVTHVEVHTQFGAVSGTPSYMAPEQARAEHADTRTDVYALGAVLHEVLTGEPPFSGHSRYSVVARVASGEVPLIEAADLPQDLVDLRTRAMSANRDDRPDDAGALATEVAAWLDGARKRAQALQVVDGALAGLSGIEAMRARAETLRVQADAALDGLDSWAGTDLRAEGWALQDEASALDAEAAILDDDIEHALRAALTHEPTLPEAHAALADRYRRAQHRAEEEGDARAAAQAARALAHHAERLPAGDPRRLRHQAWLEGDGALTLVTDPPGADVTLYRFERIQRRLQAVLVGDLGTTPLHEVPLAVGSWLLELRAEGRDLVRYPVEIRRQTHWSGVAPGSDVPAPIWLPPTGELGPDDVYVPAGWTRSGADRSAINVVPARPLWVDGFVMRRHPVTARQYLAWLDTLDTVDDALVPQDRAGRRFAARRERWELVEVDDMHLGLDEPIVLVDWHAAWRFATDHGWRLPSEFEWEKAAGGVDGRIYPWGDFIDPTWCRIRLSAGRQGVADLVAYPEDVGPYGVRGMAGNVCDWCLEGWDEAGPPVEGHRAVIRDPGHADLRVRRGGSWGFVEAGSRIGYRFRSHDTTRDVIQGFRLCRGT